MKPALFLHPHISAYPVFLLLGFFFGWLLVRFRARFYGILPRDLDNIGLLLPLAGLFGARFFARLFYAKLSFSESLKVWEGDGLVFYGGFVFGIGAVLIYGIVRRVKLTPLLDCLAPAAALGLAFGRIGCFLAGCCWGDICADRTQFGNLTDAETLQRVQTIPAISEAGWPFAVQFPRKSEAYEQHVELGLIREENRSWPVHPVQLYEAVLAAALCVYLCLRSKTARHPGDLALALLVGYALIRFGTEFLRADNKAYGFGLTFSQVVSVWILLGSAIVIGIRSRLKRRETEPFEANHLVSADGSGRSNSI